MVAQRLPGSANGARLGGALFAVFFGWPMLTYDWSVPGTKMALWILLPVLFWIVRPWFMGVWLADDGVIVRDWFRVSRISLSDIERVSVVRYSGSFSWGSIGWIPFVGSVAVLKIVDKLGKERDFAGTIGRRSSVLRTAAYIRRRGGISSPRLDFDPMQ